MALYDENGKITIDEIAAQNDIKRINAAIHSLNNSKAAIQNLINQASGGQGQTTNAILEKATELKGQIDAMINRLNETSWFISKTVSHYQWVDQQVKNIINTSNIDTPVSMSATEIVGGLKKWLK